MKNVILFITHKKSKCGVYEFGKNISYELKKSLKYIFIKEECCSMKDLYKAIKKHNPSVIIYNYHPLVMPWLTTRLIPYILYKSNIYGINITQIGIIHEVTQKICDQASSKRKYFFGKYPLKENPINQIFDLYIGPDPTLLINNNNVFKTGRLIPIYKNNYKTPKIPTIGSLGFGTQNKGFENIIKIVGKEFNEAIINLNIPFSDFGDKSGENTKSIIENCKKKNINKKIKLNITNNFFTKKQMLNFLAKNTINIFLYKNNSNESRGISSVIENAMAVKRPICISKSSMFRHISSTTPSICIEEESIKNIIKNGFKPLKQYYTKRNSEGIIKDYEKIIDSIL